MPDVAAVGAPAAPRRAGASGAAVAIAVAAALAALVAVGIAVHVLGDAPYRALHSTYSGAITALTSGLLQTVAAGAGAVCAGSLAFAAFIAARRSRARVDGTIDLRIVRWSSLVWLVASTALIAVDAADENGQPLSKLLTPGALGYLVQANYLPGAWIVVACIALTILIVANLATAWTATMFLSVIGALGVLVPVLVGQVLVGPNHDYAGDSAMFATPAGALVAGGSAALLARWRRYGRPGPTTLRRYRILVIAGASTWLGGTIVIWAVQLNGSGVLASPTGVLFLIEVVGAVIATALLVPWRASGGPAWTRMTVLRVAGLVTTWIGVIALDEIRSRIPPPVFFAPTTEQQLFLGYSVNTPMTPVTLFLNGRVNILFLMISLVGMVAYAAAVIRLRRRGDQWPIGRTIAWMLGWVSIILTTSSGVGRYASASYAVHMALHMSLNMLGPLLLVLGGPITLFLRATTAHRRDAFAGPHEWLNAFMHAPLLRFSYNPIYVLTVFVGSYYAIYLTPFFGWAMRYHWAHQGMTVHYLAIGYIFYALVIGVDAPPRPLPYIGKLGLVLAAMPFHAFFGVIVMTDSTILAKIYFQYLDVSWLGSFAHDQYVAGGIAWAAGELPLVVVVIALVTQWAKQDARQAKRDDRHADAGLDDSFERYNAMLQELSGRRGAEGEPQGALVINEHGQAGPAIAAPTGSAPHREESR
ncbi:cytochrome c oxidase assembly protein [Curtobacterium ammoniigenes]|uniref:cytochrome c oxidase assembly protein n=1 Tax=Curtobacterium ammoniigenes TaxID=395387 RepID=UPI0008376285|nr:cytochrome c oxidase assembly protein [Curtobacterium ammoniigenes]